jgi:hypothetical protein
MDALAISAMLLLATSLEVFAFVLKHYPFIYNISGTKKVTMQIEKKILISQIKKDTMKTFVCLIVAVFLCINFML